MKQTQYTYKHKPLGARPYPREEHYVRFDNSLSGDVVIIKAFKTRNDMAYEIKNCVTTAQHHKTYDPCPESTADVFGQVLDQVRKALT